MVNWIIAMRNNKEFIKDWVEKKLQSQGNPLADLERDVTIVIPGVANNPFFGTFVGIEKVKEILSLLSNKVSQQFQVVDCIAEDNQVIALIEENLIRHDDPSKHYLNYTAWLFKLNDDQKIVYLYTYDNTLVTAEALA